MPSRRRFLACAAAVAATTGCAELDPRGDPGGPTATDEPTGTPTGTVPGHEELSRQPDPDLSITVTNHHDGLRHLSLTVTRSTGAVVHESSRELDTGESVVAYNLQQADPDGVERFSIATESGAGRREISVRTSACYGDVEVGVDASGELFATYYIC